MRKFLLGLTIGLLFVAGTVSATMYGWKGDGFYTSTLDVTNTSTFSGKVGIGTLTPQSLLDIKGTISSGTDYDYSQRWLNDSGNLIMSIATSSEIISDGIFSLFGEPFTMDAEPMLSVGSTSTSAGIINITNDGAILFRNTDNILNGYFSGGGILMSDVQDGVINKATYVASDGFILGMNTSTYQGGTFMIEPSTGDVFASGTLKVYTGGSANHATCWKADSATIGYCSSVIGIDGTCTCN